MRVVVSSEGVEHSHTQPFNVGNISSYQGSYHAPWRWRPAGRRPLGRCAHSMFSPKVRQSCRPTGSIRPANLRAVSSSQRSRTTVCCGSRLRIRSMPLRNSPSTSTLRNMSVSSTLRTKPSRWRHSGRPCVAPRSRWYRADTSKIDVSRELARPDQVLLVNGAGREQLLGAESAVVRNA